MKKLLCSLFVVGALVGCQEQIDMSDRYVFTQETISGYLQNHADYSEYTAILQQVPVSILSKSTVGQLLSARGHYTCFAPTNEAIHAYLDSLVAKQLIASPSWEAFTDSVMLDSIRQVIVMNSIIDGGNVTTYQSSEFPLQGGEFQLANMKDNKLSIVRADDPDSVFVNGDALVDLRNRDILCSNGVIHQVHTVVAPSDISMGQMLQECIDGRHSDYRVMAMLVKACGLLDTLSKKRDEAYELAYVTSRIDNYPGNGLASLKDGTCYIPRHRRYGFTLFAEPDKFWQEKLGKSPAEITVDDVVSWLQNQHFYPDGKADEHYDDENNLLNLFVTYHLLPMRIPNNRLVFHVNEFGYRVGSGSAYTIPVMEHYTTMGRRRLLKIYQSAETARMMWTSQTTGIFLNRFPVLDNGRQGTGRELSCNPEKEGVLIYDNANNLNEFNSVNGMIYPIEGPLAYTSDVQDYLMATRLRFDVMSFFPEAMNNDIRLNTTMEPRYQNVAFPQDDKFKYLDNMWINKDSKTVCYFAAWKDYWNNLNGDELKGVGQYDYTFKLPPVPKRGTYEIRYKVLANGDRGVCQIYFGSDRERMPIAGIPMDLTIGGLYRYASYGNEPSPTGWALDEDDNDDYNAEVDKKMRNNGFMKGPKGYWDCSKPSRNQDNNVRRIIVRQTLDPTETYYLRFKSCLRDATKEFYIDYIEYCPKEIYDNPIEPEDIW
ncbi:MAG: fasciclin domain-containing protein [Bacteroidaceae bacterium]|nr:fasciclin domain-containing protein [Bacteroidaceae bacterium]